MDFMKEESKKDKKLLFVIVLILGLIALYIVDMTILAWRL